MAIKNLLVLLLITLFIPGCFIANELLLDDEEYTTETLQTKAEVRATEKTQSILNNEIYNPYGFSPLKIIKPVELIELEKLEKELKASPADTALKAAYSEKKRFVDEAGIERKAELDHVFTLENDSTGVISVLEFKYTFNDTLAVINMDPKVFLKLDQSYRTVLDYYFNEYTIFNATTYAEAKRLSHNFYAFFKTQLESYQSLDEKSAFFKHTINICSLVKLTGKFDPNYLTQELFKNYIAENRKDITDYESLAFSDLYETKNNVNDSIVGYYFFHKFIGNYASQKDTNVVLVEFSPYYEVGQIFQLENSFESYTNPKK